MRAGLGSGKGAASISGCPTRPGHTLFRLLPPGQQCRLQFVIKTIGRERQRLPLQAKHNENLKVSYSTGKQNEHICTHTACFFTLLLKRKVNIYIFVFLFICKYCNPLGTCRHQAAGVMFRGKLLSSFFFYKVPFNFSLKALSFSSEKQFEKYILDLFRLPLLFLHYIWPCVC